MIGKIYFGIIFFLIGLSGFLYFLSEYREKKINALMLENINLMEKSKRCENEMASYIKANTRACNTIGEIRTIIKTIESPCDCYNSAVDSAIVARVRGQ